MTRRDKWSPSQAAERYWSFKDELILHCQQKDYFPGNEIKLIFYVPMPKSWSKKKQEKMLGRPHQSRPDVDNFVKAFLDALLGEDKEVWHVDAYKFWSREGKIEVCNL
jgi:Holliday junction resolvase RusA-like endonuclease